MAESLSPPNHKRSNSGYFNSWTFTSCSMYVLVLNLLSPYYCGTLDMFAHTHCKPSGLYIPGVSQSGWKGNRNTTEMWSFIVVYCQHAECEHIHKVNGSADCKQRLCEFPKGGGGASSTSVEWLSKDASRCGRISFGASDGKQKRKKNAVINFIYFIFFLVHTYNRCKLRHETQRAYK